jgi:hypothetical protein
MNRFGVGYRLSLFEGENMGADIKNFKGLFSYPWSNPMSIIAPLSDLSARNK